MTPRDWHRTRSNVESEHRVFRVRKDAAVSPRTGVEHEFNILEADDQVAVVALTEDDRLVLVRQYRHGLREVTLELPGGLIDEGMSPEESARAELRQETGYGGGEWTALGCLAVLPAVFTNHVHVFLARGVRHLGEPEFDPGEDIATDLVPLAEARRMVMRGEIVHAPVVGALFLWELGAECGPPGPPGAAVAEHEPTAMPGSPAAPLASVIPLRDRVLALLRTHFTATVATVGEDGLPHAATVFYAADGNGRLVFLSKADSRHGGDIGARGPVAVTVAREYADWRDIQGVQLWGDAEVLRGAAKARAMAVYLRRFPFVSGLLEDPRLAARLRGIEVYRVTSSRAALTDNRQGPFGREVLEDL
ncbi:MAG: pyridoxamine 5'-phosphate oxidase family protein [Actinobacteria bacterium]|nr:pyridoxamine 5'-phosphate oxidase family protein [Actinomycetota bacterium]